MRTTSVSFDRVVDFWIFDDGRRGAVGTDCIEVLEHCAREEHFVSGRWYRRRSRV